MLSLGGMLVAAVLLDLLLWLYLPHLGRLSTPLMFKEKEFLCTRDSGSVWLRSGTLIFYVAIHEWPKTIYKFLQHSTRAQRIKAGLWVIANYMLINGSVYYFMNYGWWFTTTMSLFAPCEMAWIQWFIGDIKRRKATRMFGNMLAAAIVCPFLLAYASMAFLQRNSFSLLAYLVHVIFTVLTFGYGRLVYFFACRLLDPQQLAHSQSLQKWINWSLPVRWSFFNSLVVVPMLSPVCSCLGLFLWG